MRANADPQLRVAGTRRVPSAGQSKRTNQMKRSCPQMDAESADEIDEEKSKWIQLIQQHRMDCLTD